MNRHTILLYGMIYIIFCGCRKNNDEIPLIQDKWRVTTFSDITDGQRLAGLNVDIFKWKQSPGSLVGFYETLFGTQLTNREGEISYQDDLVFAFDCDADGYFPFHHTAVGVIGYDSTGYKIQLVPKASLFVHIIPGSGNPPGYRIVLQRSFSDSLGNLLLTEIVAQLPAIDTAITIDAAAVLNNKLYWTIVDDNSDFVEADSLANISIPKHVTRTVNIKF